MPIQELYRIIFRIVQNSMLDRSVMLVVLFDTSRLMAQTFQGITVRTGMIISFPALMVTLSTYILCFGFFKGLQAILLTCLQSFRSMSSIIVLMFLFLFIFAVIFQEMFNESDPEHFGNIFRTIFTLFQILTLDDGSLIYMTSRDNGVELRQRVRKPSEPLHVLRDDIYEKVSIVYADGSEAEQDSIGVEVFTNTMDNAGMIQRLLEERPRTLARASDLAHRCHKCQGIGHMDSYAASPKIPANSRAIPKTVKSQSSPPRFHVKAYLGHIVSAQGIATDPEKVQKVQEWPEPTCASVVRQFVGLAAYYRRFVQDFAAIAKPLHKLTKKNSRYWWPPECHDAFETLRVCLLLHLSWGTHETTAISFLTQTAVILVSEQFYPKCKMARSVF
ncbi:hypothetical protein AOLI_G00230850 [Acnodon oligacanthus]